MTDNDLANCDKNYNVVCEKTYITNDLSFAAYLLMHDVELLTARKLGKTFKFEFRGEKRIDRFKIAYTNSEISKFDMAVRRLKQLVFSEADPYYSENQIRYLAEAKNDLIVRK